MTPSMTNLSFGEAKTMMFKRANHSDLKLELKSNYFLVKNPHTNQYWIHSIPQQKKRAGIRISLTFRMLMKRGTSVKHEDVENNDSNNKKIIKEEPKISKYVFTNYPFYFPYDYFVAFI